MARLENFEAETEARLADAAASADDRDDAAILFAVNLDADADARLEEASEFAVYLDDEIEA